MQGGPDPSGSGYEMHFFTCDICTLMRELELYEFVPALCRLDYTMAETGGVNIPKKDMPKKNLKPIMLSISVGISVIFFCWTGGSGLYIPTVYPCRKTEIVGCGKKSVDEEIRYYGD